jgi:hypothetical protein
MCTITVKDGPARRLLQRLGQGPIVTLSDGRPLNSDMWDGQRLFLAEHSFRIVPHA